MTRFTQTLAATALVVLATRDAAAQTGFPEVRAGQPVQETLGGSDPRTIDGKPFKVFQFRAQPGRRYTATLESSAFDSYLVLARANGGITEIMREDDDGGDGVDARLRFTVPTAGTYLLVARSFSANSAAGPFRLALVDGGEIVVPQPSPVRVGASVRGSLTEDDGYLEDDAKSYDLYVVRGAPGQDVHVLLASEDFDAFLESGEMVNGQFRSEASNDDYDGRDSGLQLRLDSRGEAVVRATSLGSGGEGDYVLTVREGRLPPRQDEEADFTGMGSVDGR
jgi:hypothetical protein